ncbi:MAG: DUF4159 domain-containing protein [Phycisphaerales bacterium]|nr:DUF4159 domain-containing protein [Phycisphaerales bacterium]
MPLDTGPIKRPTCPRCGRPLRLVRVGESRAMRCPFCPVLRDDETAPPAKKDWRLVARYSIYGLLAIFFIGLSIWLYAHLTAPKPTWEDEHRQQIVALLNQAESLDKQGHTAEAYDRYHELDQLILGRTLDDPMLQSRVNSARQRGLALAAQLAARQQQAAATPPPQPTPSTPALPPPPPAPTVAEDENLQTPIGKRPPPQPVVEESSIVNDQRIGEALNKAINFILSHFEQGKLKPDSAGSPDQQNGLDALCVYALIQAGQATGDERLSINGNLMRQMIEQLKQLSMDGHAGTYAHSLRATALAVYNRPQDRPTLSADVKYLLEVAQVGTYTYGLPTGEQRPSRSIRWDHSNTQYGQLGVWAGADAGLSIPSSYWNDVQAHWDDTQHPTGGWGYERQNDPTLTMTCAGVASLFVAHDFLDGPRFGNNVGREPFSPALARGLAWLEKGNNILGPDSGWWGYALYGIERVGLASGFKYFGPHDWYRILATRALQRQSANGDWGNLVDTAFATLFLSRGRHPIMMNKGRFDGYWANRPRDLANLCRFASYELEQPVNWQVVNLNLDAADWMDAPILYLASHQAPNWTESQENNLRRYIEEGGLVFTQADGNSAEFNHFIELLGKRLFPQYAWQTVPEDHWFYSAVFRLKQKPALRMISNESRVLMVQSEVDLAQYWQLKDQKEHRSVFDLGVNLYAYAGAKSRVRNRLESWAIAPVDAQPIARMKVARVRYAGNWDPEPGAWGRFGRQMMRQARYDLRPQTVDLSELAQSGLWLAHLTGTGNFTPDEKQIESVHRYVTNGGILLIDVCGGDSTFARDVREKLLARAFNETLSPVPADHPMLKATEPGMSDLGEVRLRKFARLRIKPSEARPLWIRSGKGAVLFCPVDLTTGLTASMAWGVVGYEPDWAHDLLANVILWTWDGSRERARD